MRAQISTKILLARAAFIVLLRRRKLNHPKCARALLLGGRCREAALHKRLSWLSRRRVEFTDAHIGVDELRLDVDATTVNAISFGLRALGFGLCSNGALLSLITHRALELKRRFGVPCALWPRFLRAAGVRLACFTCKSRERRSSGRRLNLRLNEARSVQ